MKTHIEIKHKELCTECNTVFDTEEELFNHITLVHEFFDDELTQDEFDSFTYKERESIRKERGTPKQKDLTKKYELRLRQTKLKI